MNFTEIYSSALKAPRLDDKKDQENEDSAQIILSDEKLRWQQNTFTQQLFNFLRHTKQHLLEECVTSVGDGEKVKSKLHKVKQIQEIIDYGTSLGTTKSQ